MTEEQAKLIVRMIKQSDLILEGISKTNGTLLKLLETETTLQDSEADLVREFAQNLYDIMELTHIAQRNGTVLYKIGMKRVN